MRVQPLFAKQDEDWSRQMCIALVTLSLVMLLFFFGWFAGSSTCKSAAVGRPGFTTVKSVSSGILVSCEDNKGALCVLCKIRKQLHIHILDFGVQILNIQREFH